MRSKPRTLTFPLFQTSLGELNNEAPALANVFVTQLGKVLISWRTQQRGSSLFEKQCDQYRPRLTNASSRACSLSTWKALDGKQRLKFTRGAVLPNSARRMKSKYVAASSIVDPSRKSRDPEIASPLPMENHRALTQLLCGQ